MFAAALNGDVEGGLTWGGGGRTVTPGSCTAETRPSLKGVGCSVETGWGLQARALASSTQRQQWTFSRSFPDVASLMQEVLGLQAEF